VLVHGFKGFMHWAFFPELARRLAAAGFAVVSYNASHNGVSARPGDPEARFEIIDDDEAFERNTHGLEWEDLALVRAWTVAGCAGQLEVERLGLYGHSRGGGIALLSAAQDPPDALVIWAPIDDVDRIDAATKEVWRRAGRLPIPNLRTGQVHHLGLEILDEFEADRARFDILAAAARVVCPSLVVHGTADDAVPVTTGERVAKVLPSGSLLAIEGANHAFGATHPLRPTPDGMLHGHLERALGATVEHFVRWSKP